MRWSSPVAAVGWWAGGGGEAAIGAAGQLPAPFVDGPMVGPADQREVPQVGRATVDPVPQVMGVTPGQRAFAAREDTTSVPDGQGAVLGRGYHPGRPPQVQGLAGRPTQGRGEQGHGGPQPPLQPYRRAGVEVGARVEVGGQPLASPWSAPWP